MFSLFKYERTCSLRAILSKNISICRCTFHKSCLFSKMKIPAKNLRDSFHWRLGLITKILDRMLHWLVPARWDRSTEIYAVCKLSYSIFLWLQGIFISTANETQNDKYTFVQIRERVSITQRKWRYSLSGTRPNFLWRHGLPAKKSLTGFLVMRMSHEIVYEADILP